MKKAVIYIHGKGGNAKEALHYADLFKDCEVIGFDYKADTPWEAEAEFSHFFDEVNKRYGKVYLIANSIGAFFSMSALCKKKIEKAYFISPIVDMEKLIEDMMKRAGVTENELLQKGEIKTDFGETLSWEYLNYVRNNPINWNIPTFILYGENDSLTSFETVSAFSKKIGASLTVMKGGEHWFHTKEETEYLDEWIRNSR